MTRMNRRQGVRLDASPIPTTPTWQGAQPTELQPVVDYNQAADERLKKLPSLQGGACLAMAIFWVKHAKIGTGLVQWLRPPKAACTQGIDALDYEITHGGDGLQVVMNAQKKLYEEAVATYGEDLSKMTVFRQQILKWAGAQCVGAAGEMLFKTAASVDTLAVYIRDQPGYCIFTFWIKDWGGHACAACSVGNHVVYFDPNWGVFQVPKAQFVEWLSGKFDAAYHKKIVDNGGVIAA